MPNMQRNISSALAHLFKLFTVSFTALTSLSTDPTLLLKLLTED
uniref:Uncharacterized protein n=1 Tax=Ciona intestinalis TaxID=7719 RepID=H2XQV3_CIOIN